MGEWPNKMLNKRSHPQKVYILWGPRLAQSVEHATFDLGVVSSSSRLGIKIVFLKSTYSTIPFV